MIASSNDKIIENPLGINGFDFDGVISIGICPGPKDVIITGRSFEESEYIFSILRERNINNAVYFNTMHYDGRKREDSGKHKAHIIKTLIDNGVVINKFFEDDEIQIEEIKKVHPKLQIIHVKSNLVEK